LVPEAERVAQAVRMIAAAKRPLFYGGGGLINSGPEACARFTELVRLADAPCTVTLMGLGAFPASDPHFLGMVGMHGTYEANLAMHGCDLLVAVGARFDDRVTGRLNAFSPGSKKIHIDIDPSSINKNVRVDLPVIGDVGEAAAAMLAAWPHGGSSPNRRDWWRLIEEWRARDCLRYDRSCRGPIKPQYAIERLYALTRDHEVYVTTEVGQHQMWAAQFFKFDRPNHWMTSGGLGTMGYACRRRSACRWRIPTPSLSTSPARPRS